MDKKLSKKTLLGIIIGVVAVIAIIVAVVLANRNKLTAIVMRLIRQEGEVTLLDASGQGVSILEDMKLYSGNSLLTGGDGLADLSLDDTKFLTIEHTSNVEFEKEGKALALKLKQGRLFFNVTEKLADDESMEISTSTMVVGIRGTSGYVDADNSDIFVGDGTVHVTGINPDTGDTVETDLTAGQKAHVYLVEQDGKTVAFELTSYTVQEIPREMLRNIVTVPELFKRILEETDFSAKEIIKEAIIKKILPEEMILDEDMQKVLEEVLEEMNPKEEVEAEVEPEEEEEEETPVQPVRRRTTAAAPEPEPEPEPAPAPAPAAAPAASSDSGSSSEQQETTPTTYSITVASATGGTASASTGTAEAGTTITLTATPDAGYEFTGWSVSGGDVSVSNNSFTMPSADVTVTPMFSQLPVRTLRVVWGIAAGDFDSYNREFRGGTVSTSPAGSAVVTPEDQEDSAYISSTTVEAYRDAEITITAQPSAGYRFVGWVAQGGAVVANTGSASTTVTMPDADASVKTIYEHIRYTVHIDTTNQPEDFVTGLEYDLMSQYTPGTTYQVYYGKTLNFYSQGLDQGNQGNTYTFSPSCYASDGGTVTITSNGTKIEYTPSWTDENPTLYLIAN